MEASRFFVELGAFELRRCSGSIASLLDFLREAAMRLRLICGCYCGQFLRQLPKFIILCTTSCRSSIEGLTTKFHSLEHSHEGLILYTASFHCQYRGLSIEYQCAWLPQRFVTVILFREIRMRIGSKYLRRRKVWS